MTLSLLAYLEAVVSLGCALGDAALNAGLYAPLALALAALTMALGATAPFLVLAFVVALASEVRRWTAKGRA